MSAPPPSDFKLGLQARDRVSGVEGIITARIDYLSGVIHIGVSPPSPDKSTEPQTYFWDYHRLEVTGDGIRDVVVEPDENVPIALGAKVESVVTGLTGIANERWTFLNGCTQFNVVAKPTGKSEGHALQGLFDWKELKVIDDHTVLGKLGRNLAKAGLPADEPSPVGRGGPGRRTASRSTSSAR